MGREGKKCWFWHVFLLIIALASSGCASLPDPETSQSLRGASITRLTPGHTVGQSFISKRPRLDGISLWLEPEDPGTHISISLRHKPSDPKPLFSALIQVVYGQNTIEIPPQDDLPSQDYYLQLGLTQGEVLVLGREEDIYPHGTATLDGLPIDADIAFQATYNYDLQAVFTDMGNILEGGWLALPLALLLFIPGWLLLDLTDLRNEYDPSEQIAVSTGLSISLIPVLMLWTTTLGLRWNRRSVLVAAGLLVCLFLWRVWVQFLDHRTHSPKQPGIKSHRPSSLIMPAIFLLSFFVRYAMVRDLEMPAWVDSIHHSLISLRIVQVGGFPGDYLPYLPMEASQYHPGFHSLVAAFHWLSDLDVPHGMLVLGQVLNAATIFGAYLLTTTLVRDKRAGWASALITGTLSLMPAYYAGWGRYTQLAGLLILPVAYRWIFPVDPEQGFKKPKFLIKLVLGSILFAGLFMVHYRVTIFLICLVVATWIGRIYRSDTHTWKYLAASFTYTMGIGVLGMLASLPWMIPVVRDFMLPLASQWQSGVTPPADITWRYLTPVLGVSVMVLAVTGLAWGIYQRRRFTISILIWVLLLFGIANSGYFHLPFPPGFVNQSSVEIMLYLPFSVLGGYAVIQVYSLGENIKRPGLVHFWKNSFLVLLVVAAVVGSQKMVASLNPGTILYRQADTAGISWLKENIPGDETIVINPEGWGYGLYMGADGGYWISPLTGLETMPPNVLYGLNAENHHRTNRFVAQLIPVGEDPEQIWDLLGEYDLRYIYTGGKGGVFSPQALDLSPLFETLYKHDGIWVFKTVEKP